jgi:hypothetical protein
METPSKSLGWLSIILFNLIVFLFYLGENSSTMYQLFNFPLRFISNYSLPFLATLFLSVVPFLISNTKAAWVKKLILWIFIISLFAVICGFIQMSTCSGKFCGLIGALVIAFAAPIGICFPLFYGVGVSAAPKRNIWMYLFLGIEIAIILGLALTFAPYGNLNSLF